MVPALHAEPLVIIDVVGVGDPGNAPDTTVMLNDDTSGYGAVADPFNIGRYEVTISQYNTFLNAVASVTSDSYVVDLWNSSMQTDANIAGISRAGSGTLADPYSYLVMGSENHPISYVSWHDAARFANWMHNGATAGASTETGAYTMNGATTGIILKNSEATWFLPSDDQWYKAAYYKGGGVNAGYWAYATQSDTVPDNTIGSPNTNQANYLKRRGNYMVTQSPVKDPNQNYLTDVGAFTGSPAPYGTFDQSGSMYEWNDAVLNSTNRGKRGGNWDEWPIALASNFRCYDVPTVEQSYTGFRLASAAAAPEVPESGTMAAGGMLLGGVVITAFLRRQRRHLTA